MMFHGSGVLWQTARTMAVGNVKLDFRLYILCKFCKNRRFPPLES